MNHSPAVDQIRRFERFYEKRLRKALRTAAIEDFTAADIRVLSELGWSNAGRNGAWLSDRLDLDPSYLRRVLKKLEAYDLVVSRSSARDARRVDWELTRHGRRFADDIETEYRDRVSRALLDVFPDAEVRLLDAMSVIMEILGTTRASPW